MGRGERLMLVGIVAAAAALRAGTLGLQSFDFDEAYTVQIVHGSLGHVFDQVPVTESTPPLYYVLAWLWSRLFGVGEIGLRSLSAVAGTLLVPVAFAAGRRLAGVRAGLLAALLTAFNPLMVWYSQEARSYALLALLSGLSFWAFLVVRDDPRPRPRSLGAWGLSSAAALATHYFAAFLVVAEAVPLLWRRRRPAVGVAVGVVVAAGAALTPLAVDQARHNRTQWIESLSLPARIREVGKKWLTGEISPTRTWELVVLLVVAGTAVGVALRHGGGATRPAVMRAAGVGILALALPLVLDLAGLHYMISKNVMPALTVLLIAAGVSLGAVRSAAGLLGAGLLAAFFLGMSVAVAFDASLQRPDYRALARAAGPEARDQVVVSPRLGDAPLAVYRTGAVPVNRGWPVRELLVAFPLPRADVHGRRPATPPAPVGFRLAGRTDASSYTLVCYLPMGAAVPAQPQALAALAGSSAPTALGWPAAGRASAPLPAACAG